MQDRVGRMRKRPGRVCNKLCSPGVRRFQLVPCVPARQTPSFFVGLVARDETSLIPFWILDTASGKNAKSQRLLHARTLDSDQDENLRNYSRFFPSFPRVSIHKIGSLYVKLGGGDKPGRVVCVTWRAGLTWCPRVGAGRIPVLSLDQGNGPRTGWTGWTGSGFRWPLVCRVGGGSAVLSGGFEWHTAGYFWARSVKNN